MDYAEVVRLAQAYADRIDVEVTANIDSFIVMAESRINRALRVAEQTHRIYTQSIAGREYYTLPPEFNGMRVIQFNNGQVDNSEVMVIEYVTPEQLVACQAKNSNKNYYTIINNQLQFHPTLPAEGTIEMVFYRKVPHLDAENDKNWISLSNPDIYISAITCEIELFVKNFDSSVLWNTRMQDAIESLRTNDIDKRWTGVGLTMRIM